MDDIIFNISKIVKRKYYSCVAIEILMRHYNFKITSDTVLNDVRTLWLNSQSYGKIKMNMQFGYYDNIIKNCKEYITLCYFNGQTEMSFEWMGMNYYEINFT